MERALFMVSPSSEQRSSLPGVTKQFGPAVNVRQETAYSWNGTIALRLSMDEPSRFGLRLRLPGWCQHARLTVNGEAFDVARHLEQGYVRVERVWQADDSVELELAMPVERMYAHP